MHCKALPVLALTTLALASLAVAPAMAGAPVSDPRETARQGDGSATAVAARRAGHFSCSPGEVRTKLERKNCGSVRF